MTVLKNSLRGFLMIAFGIASYGLFVATFLYLIAFVGNLPPAPRTINTGPASAPLEAVVVNLLLLAVFAAQHSVMARQGFKRWWTRFVPQPVERSTYVLAAALALLLMMWQWRPIAMPVVWNVGNAAGVIAIQAVFWLGWVVLFVSSHLIDHFELFGLKQVFAHLIRTPRTRA
jgi:protein-S-isoprenylcysteine O-methyltransferase Ste14